MNLKNTFKNSSPYEKISIGCTIAGTGAGLTGLFYAASEIAVPLSCSLALSGTALALSGVYAYKTAKNLKKLENEIQYLENDTTFEPTHMPHQPINDEHTP